MNMKRRFNGVILFLALISFGVGLEAVFLRNTAGASSKEEGPAPASVDEIVNPMEQHFQKKPEGEGPLISETLKEKVKDLPPFFRDMNFHIKPRTYFFYESKPNTHPPPERKISEAWALGGSLAYESGWWMNRVALGAGTQVTQR
jgi:hypothetical protein